MDWKQIFIEGSAKAVASIICLPITFLILKGFVWSGVFEWAALPSPDNRQIMLAAFFIAVFGR